MGRKQFFAVSKKIQSILKKERKRPAAAGGGQRRKHSAGAALALVLFLFLVLFLILYLILILNLFLILILCLLPVFSSVAAAGGTPISVVGPASFLSLPSGRLPGLRFR